MEERGDSDLQVGQSVRAQVFGWKESRRWEPGSPLLTDVSLHVTGTLSSREGRFGTIWCVDEHDVVPETIRPDPPAPGPAWDELVERSDTPWSRRLRRRQAWYRHHELGLPAGLGGSPPHPVASMLPEEAVAADPTLNFLNDDQIYGAAVDRLQEPRGKGLVKQDRLLHNLLSSQPMCFNLFAALDDLQLLTALRQVFGLSPTAVKKPRFEWAPDPEEDFRSGAAFDCFIAYDTANGPGFLGIETKYAENLSRQKPSTEPEKYVRRTERPGSGFKPGAAGRLARPITYQLWYNTILAQSLRRQGDWAEGIVAMVAGRDDPHAEGATQALRAELEEPDSMVRHATIEAIVESVGECAWADHFRRRYLMDPPAAT
ncbi:MAG: PGN_0703 family putative restriction endonuclease [Acidimicrobiia bacterium]